jgi:hypothetical protein
MGVTDAKTYQRYRLRVLLLWLIAAGTMLGFCGPKMGDIHVEVHDDIRDDDHDN